MKPNHCFTTLADVQMPKIIYGTAWKKERTAEYVEHAIALGFRGIDTACQPKHYHEPGVGDGIAACIKRGLLARPDLYLQTKFTSVDGQDPLRIPYNAKATLDQQVAQSIQVSLNNLQTDYLDGLVLHSPMPTLGQTCQVWSAMERHVRSGTVRQLGISNCYDLKTFETLYDFAEIKPAVIQNRFYAQTGYDVGIRQYCQQLGIIYQSFWTLTANPHLLSNPKLKSLAFACQRSPAQLLFRYLTQIGIAPLTGTTSPSHMREDLGIFEFELTADECELIASLLH